MDTLCGLESFATVHHLVSTVVARLREGRGRIDLLRALFPGGSITGAPKIRAMEVIAGLEEEERGIYSGSIGYLSRDGELQACYALGDVFVFASQTETQGLVLLEAMAAGVPVVSTAFMGTRDILREGRGALVALDSAADFAAKVVRVLEDAELRRELGASARAWAGEWTAGRFAAELAGLYREVIALRAERG